MSNPLNVLISYSGQASHLVAEKLDKTIKRVFGGRIVPCIHDSDRQSGRLWLPKLEKTLKATRIAILCITHENNLSPWIHYEAGVCYRKKKGRAFVFLCDVNATPLKGPLRYFNAINGWEEKAVKELFSKLNKELRKRKRLTGVDGAVNRHWNTIERTLLKARKAGDLGAWTVDERMAKTIFRHSGFEKRQLIEKWELDGKLYPLKDGAIFKALADCSASDEQVILRGPLGIGKSVLLHQFLATDESGSPNEKCLIDVNALLEQPEDDFPSPETISRRVLASLRRIGEESTPLVILDGIDSAARRIAVRTDKQTPGIVKTIMKAVFAGMNQAFDERPWRLLLSADDSVDGTKLVPAETLHEYLKENKSVRTIKLTIGENERKRWPQSLKPFGKRTLAVFLDASFEQKSGESPVTAIKSRLIKNKELGLPFQLMFDACVDIEEWRKEMLQWEESEPLDACVAPILTERTWEWLYLVKLAYSNDSSLKAKLIQLHEKLRCGERRNSKALSNVVSLLAYMEQYAEVDKDERKYVHCNLEGVLLPRDLTDVKFRATNLTDAKNKEAVHSHGAEFFDCLFDKGTLEKLCDLPNFSTCLEDSPDGPREASQDG